MKRVIDYKSLETQNLECKFLYKRFWHFGAHSTELANNRDFIILKIYDFEVVLYNDNGEIIAFYNACPHRGSRLLSADIPGSSKNSSNADKLLHANAANCTSPAHCKGNRPIRCLYHNWSYSNGKLSIPYKEEFSDYEGLDLFKLKVAKLGEFIFFADSPLMDLEKQVGHDFYKELEMVSASIDNCVDINTESIFDSNWKIGVENSLEQYHLGFVHPNSLNSLDLWDNPQFSAYNSKCVATVRNQKAAKKLARIKPNFLDSNYYEEGYFSYFLFPFSFVSSTCGYSYGIQSFFPHVPNRTHFISRSYMAKGTTDNAIFSEGMIVMNKRIFDEDGAVSTSVQQGSRVEDMNFAYAKIQEQRIGEFHRVYDEFMA